MGQNLPLTDLGNKMVQLINSGNAHDFSRFKAEMSVEKAVKEGSLLQVLYKNQPEEALELVSYLIVDFANSINVGKNISDAQVDDIACVICTRFKDLKLEELVIVFSNAKAGLYGKMYDRLDIVIISEFISKYQSGEKADYLEKANHHSSFSSNSILDAIVNSDVPDNPKVKETQAALKDLVSGNKPIDKSKYTPTAVIPKDTDYLEKARKLIPAFNLKELQVFRRHALQANWPELLEMIDAEILIRGNAGKETAEKSKSTKNQHKKK